MAGISYWQLGFDFMVGKQTAVTPTIVAYEHLHSKITYATHCSYFNGMSFARRQTLKKVQEIENGKLARSQQGDSNKSES